MKNFIVVLLALTLVGVVGFMLTSGDVADTGTTGTQSTEAADAEHNSASHPDAIETGYPVPSKAGPWPKAVAAVTEYDFGRMQVGAELEHIFTIENHGDGDLNLLPGDPTCKCTAFELSRTTVKPGESADLLVRWHGKFKDQGFQHGGPVYTDDPDQTEIRFVVKGAVDAAVELFPSDAWNLGSVTDSKPAELQAMICSRVFEEFAITEIRCESPFVETSIEPLVGRPLKSLGALCGYYINVKVLPGVPPGLIEEDLEILIDQIKDGPVKVRISATKQGPMKVISAKGGIWVASSTGLKLGQFSASKGREATLVMLVEKEGMEVPLELTEMNCSPSFLKIDLIPDGAAGEGVDRYKISVKVPPGIPRIDRSSSNPASVEIKTNHPSGQIFRMKVSFKAF